MADEVIGTARVDITGNSSGVETAAARAKQSIASMAQDGQAQYSRLSAAEKRRVDGLTRQDQAIRRAIAQQLQLNDALGAGSQTMEILVRRVAFNPITAAIAGFAALAIAWKKGNDELKGLNQYLTMTGNALGVTSGRVSEMAAQMDKMSGVTRGGALAVLVEIAKSGKVAGDQLQAVAEIAVRSNQLLGRSVSDVVSEFSRLADDPAKAAAKLNKQYNFLTSSVYSQIRALEEQGRVQDAAALAQETFARATKDRLDEVQSQLGFLERAWIAVKGAAKDTWDAMLGLGRKDTLGDQIARIDQQIKELHAGGARAEAASISARYAAQAGITLPDPVQTLERQKAFLLGMQQTQANIARAQQLDAKDQQAAIDAQGKVGALLDSVAPKAEKAARAMAAYHRELDAIRRADPNSSLLTPENIAKGEAAIRDRFRDRASAAGPRNDAATRLLMSLREQEASLRAQVNSTEKLTSSQSALAKFEQQIADLKTKQTLTADEKSILAAQDKLRAQLQINVAVEREAESKKAIIALEQRSAQINEQMASSRDLANERYQRMLNSFGMGDKAMHRTQEETDIFKEFRKRQDALAKGLSPAALESNQYKAESAKIQEELQRRLAMHKSYYETVDELQSSWAHGASQGMTNYADDAMNAFKNVGSFANKTFSEMEDMLTNFFMTGKLNTTDFVNFVEKELIRLAVQQEITGPLAKAMSGGGGLNGFLGTAIDGLTSLFGGSSLPSTASWALPTMPSANGNVFASKNLSSHSGEIWNSPTYFKFARGAAFGVGGEAGPEAIMPLKRLPNGRLGVQAQSQDSGGSQNASSARSIVVQMTINTPDANSFRKSQGQIAREFGSLSQRAMTRS